MNLLLLLSALLAALSGVGGTVRAPAQAQAVASAVAPQIAPVQRPRSSARPIAYLPTLGAVAIASVQAVVVTLALPAWTNRRRE